MSQENSGTPARSSDAPRPGIRGGITSGSVQGFSPLPTGTRVGELSIQSVLGAGEFGITYVTEHEKRSKRYALKEYFPRAIAVRDGRNVVARPDAAAAYKWGLERFLSEARGLQEVRHPAIVSVLGITRQGGTGYVGMAYEQGVDFTIWLHERKRVASQDELDPLFAPLLEGVTAAHARKVFHFDITPDCLIVRESGEPVLVDFGVFRVGLRRRMPTSDLRQLNYAAPELISQSGGPIGPWTDVYALAGLLYLAVSGRPPVSAMERANGATFEPVTAVAKGKYRSDFLQAIDWGLKLSPIQRPRTVAEWSKALQRPAGTRFALSFWPARSGADAAKPPVTPHAAPPSEEPVALGGTPVEEKTAEAIAETTPLMPEDDAGSALPMPLLAALGIVLGAVAGGLIGYGAARLLRPECTGGNCELQLVLPFAVIGAGVGLWEVFRYLRKRERRQREASAADI